MEHKRLLEGGCFVIDRGGLDKTSSGDWHQAVVVDRDSGASAMSQFRVCLDGIDTPVRRFPDADCVLFVLKGRGTVVIGGRRFDLLPECGAFIGPGEAFRIVPVDGALELLLTVCPQSEEGEWLEQMAEDFDDSYPQRVALVDEKKREATGDRFYQVLVETRGNRGPVLPGPGRCRARLNADHAVYRRHPAIEITPTFSHLRRSDHRTIR